jgi:protoheme IX farnesyltransferase
MLAVRTVVAPRLSAGKYAPAGEHERATETLMATTQTKSSSRPRDWLILAKPGIVVTNVMTAAAGLWLAPVEVGLATAAAALGGTGLLVAGSGALNQAMERDTDAYMKRTSTRPLPSGRLSLAEAVAVGLVEILAGLWLLGGFVNATAAWLGLIATVVYVFVYTPLKRRSSLAIPLGGIAGAMPPAIGWTAATGSLDVGALALFNILFWWQMPHFLGIALFRAADYRNAGLQVAPAPVGYRRTVFWIRAISLITLASVLALPFLIEVGWPFMSVALLGTVGPMAYIVRPVDYERVDAWGKRVFLSSLISLPLFAIGALAERLLA